MEMEKFIETMDGFGYGVIAFNTYKLNNTNYCYIMVSERCTFGRFIKDESRAIHLNFLLDLMVQRVRRAVKGDEAEAQDKNPSKKVEVAP